MKAERRHELQQNELADWLGKNIEQLRPYGKLLSGAIVAGLVLWAVFLYTSSQRTARQGAAWDELFKAMQERPAAANDPSGANAQAARRAELERVAKKFEGGPAGVWAVLMLAETELEQGLQTYYRSRTEAQDTLNHAIELFSQAQKAAGDPIIEQRAAYGLARAYEARFKFDESRKEYKRLVDTWPEGMFHTIAQEQLARLESASMRSWYEAYENLSSASPPLGGRPGFDPHQFPIDLPPSVRPPISLTPPPPEKKPDAPPPSEATPEKKPGEEGDLKKPEPPATPEKKPGEEVKKEAVPEETKE